MNRPTKKQIESTFEYFCDHFGFRVAESWNDVGALRLDNAPTYGGYLVEKITSLSGSVSHPFSSRRMRPTALVDALYFAVHAGDASKLCKKRKRR